MQNVKESSPRPAHSLTPGALYATIGRASQAREAIAGNLRNLPSIEDIKMIAPCFRSETYYAQADQVGATWQTRMQAGWLGWTDYALMR